jgi:hypothetical protein
MPARAVLVVALWVLSAGTAQAMPSTLEFPPTAAFSGERGTIPLQSVTDFGYQGFSVSATYDAGVLSLADITITGTIVEAIQADFFQANIFADQGRFVIGCLVDSTPPFDERMIPGATVPLALVNVLFDVPPQTLPQTTLIKFVDGGGDPPINNVLSVSNQSVRPDQLIDGVINIVRRPVFVRGDANQDTTVNVADPVFTIGFLFQDRTPPPCMDAADANDDGVVDLADAIFILQYYFMRGIRPPAPFPNPGVDPTPNRHKLGCLQPAF